MLIQCGSGRVSNLDREPSGYNGSLAGRANKWDRIAPKGANRGETSREFGAFQVYLQLGPTRSIAKAAESKLQPGGNLKTAERLWQKRSSQWNWVERAAAYDEHTEARVRKDRERWRKQVDEKRFEFMIAFQDHASDLALSQLAKFKELLKTAGIDVEQTKPDGTVSRVLGVSASELAALSSEVREAARSAGFEPPEREWSANGPTRPGVFEFVKPPAGSSKKRRFAQPISNKRSA